MTNKIVYIVFLVLNVGFANACDDKDDCVETGDWVDSIDDLSEPQAVNSCEDVTAQLTVSGEIIYDEYETGQIRLTVIEEYSHQCLGNGNYSSYTPGDQIGELILDEPGDYEITLKDVLVVGTYRTLYFIFENTIDSKCIGGRAVAITPEDPNASEMEILNINIELKKDNCPLLI